MDIIRRAVIDVGTNSVKLLVADVQGGMVTPVTEESEQTRLGAGFFENNRLQPQAIAHTAQAVENFAAKARELHALTTRVIATSAARDALNADELIFAIHEASGLKVEIITGELEADLAFRGVNTDAEFAGQPMLLLDVGGGSTEFILGQGDKKLFRESFRLGTVRLLEQMPPSDPPAAHQLAAARSFVKQFLAREVRTRLADLLSAGKTQLVGTGGTATILGRMENKLVTYDRPVIEQTRLGLAQLRAHVERLWGISLEQRRATVIGLPKNRADVVLPGVVIYEGVMETFGFSELRITTRGLRFAAVLGN